MDHKTIENILKKKKIDSSKITKGTDTSRTTKLVLTLFVRHRYQPYDKVSLNPFVRHRYQPYDKVSLNPFRKAQIPAVRQS